MSSQDTAATVREWTDVLSRIRFGTVKVAGKNITGARIKLVAGRLANYADSDGTRVRPGIARLAVDCEVEYRTAKSAVALLRRLGLLQLTKAAGKPGHADEYRLALPSSLMEEPGIEVWSPARHLLEMERVRDANRGRYKARVGSPDEPICGVQETPQKSDLRGPEDPAEPVHPTEPAGSSGTDISRPAGSSGTDLRGPEDPATYQAPRHNYDLPTAEPPLTSARPSRAKRSNSDSRIGSQPPRPGRCDHGLAAGQREDGQANCPVCRSLARIDAAPVARVIPIRTTA